MYYHIKIETDNYRNHYSLNNNVIEDLLEIIVFPYLNNQKFEFDGGIIDPSDVSEFLVTKTEYPSHYYVHQLRDYYKKHGLPYVSLDGAYFVTEEDMNFEDITEEAFKMAANRNIHSVTKLSTQPQKEHKELAEVVSILEPSVSKKTVFLAYSYRSEDDEFVSGFKRMIERFGFNVLDGKADQLGSISQAILNKIRQSDFVVIVMTKRDEKKNRKYTTSAWLLEEKGAALALGKKVAMMVEEEVDADDIGGLHGDDQRFQFSRNNFAAKAMDVLEILDKSH